MSVSQRSSTLVSECLIIFHSYCVAQSPGELEEEAVPRPWGSFKNKRISADLQFRSEKILALF